MSDDICERLKRQSLNRVFASKQLSDGTMIWHPMMLEAADEITRLRAENERLREAFEKAANDMRPMLRSMISRNEAEEIVRRAARAAFEGVTEKSGAGNE